MGYEAVAIADRDNLYGLPEFLDHAQYHGVRAIIAAELTGAGDEGDALVYAHGDEGYANLCRLISERHCEKRFVLARSIASAPTGLHVVSASLSLLRELHHKVPVYFRLQRPRRPPAEVRKEGIPCLVVPQSVFSGDPQEYETHRLLRAIDGNTTLARLDVEGECLSRDAVLEPWGRVQQRFEVFDEALAETVRFGRNLVSRTQFSTIIFPQLGPEKDAIDRLRALVLEGARKRYQVLSDEVVERIEYELDIIARKGFASYFLIVDDIVRQSPRTCGRGSAAASIVSYCLGITNVDPIRYNLFFERFLNYARADPPDIDVDFAWDERDRVLDYVFEKYGAKHAAMVATHGTFGMRMALREVARVYGLTESEISAVTKRLPMFYHFDGAVSIAGEVASSAVTKGMSLDPPWPAIMTGAQRIVGLPCSIGTHCGGVVITPGLINRTVPIQYSAKGYPIIQWEKDGAEDMGLVKIDLLGNRSLAVIRDALACLRREGVTFDEMQWDPASDGATIDLLARGKTMGVFYVESPAMRLLQERSQAGDFEHMTIHSSLIRPAANRYTREYINRLHGGAYKPLHPLLAETLAETYGIMVYQEDVTKVAMRLAGFSLADAEGLRKAIGKKSRKAQLRMYHSMFVEGAQRKGVSEEVVAEVWDMMMAFAGYSFCKPHSASYVQVSFQSAWLKKHYPAAFMAAVISNFGGFYSTQAYVSETQRLGVAVVPPDVNRSDSTCYSHGRSMVVGLQHIKGLSNKAREAIRANRKTYGEYRTLGDLLERTLVGESDAERLVLSGACDCLEPTGNRSKLFWSLRAFFHGNASGAAAPRLRPYSRVQSLVCQYDTLGFLVAIHPLTVVRPRKRGKSIYINKIWAYTGQWVSFYGWCVTTRTLTTIHGEGMQFVTFEDETGLVETVLFPKVYAQFARHIQHHEGFLVWGHVEEEFGSIYVQVQGVKPIGGCPRSAQGAGGVSEGDMGRVCRN